MPPKNDILKIRIPADLKDAAEGLAKNLGESLSMVVRAALRHYLDHYEDDGEECDATLDQPVKKAEKPFPVLSADQAKAVAELLAASKRLQDVGGTYSVDPGHRNGDGI